MNATNTAADTVRSRAVRGYRATAQRCAARDVDFSRDRSFVFRRTVPRLHGLSHRFIRTISPRPVITPKSLLGGINTAILLFSSTLMALAVRAAELRDRKQLVWLLLGTAFLGIVFMALKGSRVSQRLDRSSGSGLSISNGTKPIPMHAQIFFWLYFAMTGLHAIHVTVGIFVMLVLAFLARLGKFTTGQLHAGRSRRTLLALRRHRLDFSFPAAVSGRTPIMETTHIRQKFIGKRARR